jgi:hypothetical protein
MYNHIKNFSGHKIIQLDISINILEHSDTFSIPSRNKLHRMSITVSVEKRNVNNSEIL